MTTAIPPALTLETRAAPAGRVDGVETAEAEGAAAPAVTVATQSAAEAGKLLVRFDDEAGRFVQTMTDASSQEAIWIYPREAQLAYSRAVMAYLRALSRR